MRYFKPAILVIFQLLVSTIQVEAEQKTEPNAGGSMESPVFAAPAVRKGMPNTSAQILINEPINIVWEAVKAHRCSDPSRRKLVSYDGKIAVVKEQFPSTPVIGSAECTYAETEVQPGKSIAYKMISSNHFHCFEGCWTLEAGSIPNTTKVKLTATIDPGIRFPFWQEMAKSSMEKDLRGTLSEVKEIAEKIASQKDKSPKQ